MGASARWDPAFKPPPCLPPTTAASMGGTGRWEQLRMNWHALGKGLKAGSPWALAHAFPIRLLPLIHRQLTEVVNVVVRIIM